MEKRDYNIEGMTCSSCQIHVEKAIRNVEGVRDVSVNLITNKAHVETEEGFDDSTLEEAVANSGYSARREKPIEEKVMELSVEGMTCSACANHVTRALNSVDGVTHASVSEILNQAKVTYDPRKARFLDMKEAVDKAGYSIKVLDRSQEGVEKKSQRPFVEMVLGLVIAAFILLITMGQMFAIKIPLPEILSLDTHPLVNVMIQWILTLPVVYLNRHIFIKGFKTLAHKAPNMDTLVAMGTSAAIIYSIYGTVQIILGYIHYAHHMYLESAVVILALIRFGKYIEQESKSKTADAIKALLNLKPKTALLVRDSEVIEIDVDDIRLGDVLQVKPGMAIPMDGEVIEGNSAVDESMLTGESIPVDKKIGSLVVMGSMNINGTIQIKTTVDSDDTKLSQIIKMVEQAQTDKAPIAKIADKVSGVFVPVVLVLATISGLFWFFYGGDIEQALTVFVTVLVIACPCALGLATPTAIMVGTGLGAKHGIFIKSAESLEAANHINTIVFDKTGTLTHGKPVVTDIKTFKGSKESLMTLVLSLEILSEHPLATAMVNKAQEMGLKALAVDQFKALLGQGVEGVVDSKMVRIGNAKVMAGLQASDKAQEMIDSLSKEGKTVMVVVEQQEVCGVIAVADTLKEDAQTMIADLHKLGIQVAMLTGDHQLTADAIAKQLGIDSVFAQVMPEEKAQHVAKLQEQGSVMMVGDGINDAVALVQSDVGVAIGSGTDVAVESADIVLMNQKLHSVVSTIKLSRNTMTNIKQNLFWAFAYNVIGIPFAMGVFKLLFNGPMLNPMIAGGAMAFSSVSVVLNALRLKNKKI